MARGIFRLLIDLFPPVATLAAGIGGCVAWRSADPTVGAVAAVLLLSAAARVPTMPRTAAPTANPFDRLRSALAAAAAVTLAPERMRALEGPEIAAALRAARIEALAAV